MYTLGMHGLSCHFSAGHHFHYAILNDSFHRGVSSAIPPLMHDWSWGKPSQWNNHASLLKWQTINGVGIWTLLPLPIYPVCPPKWVQLQPRQCRTRYRSTVASHAYHCCLWNHWSLWPMLHVFPHTCGLPHSNTTRDKKKKLAGIPFTIDMSLVMQRHRCWELCFSI